MPANFLVVARHGEQNLEAVIRDIKKYTSTKLIEAIHDNDQESRKELFLWLFERAGKSNRNNTQYQSRSLSGGSNIVILSN
jgi:putative transposase